MSNKFKWFSVSATLFTILAAGLILFTKGETLNKKYDSADDLAKFKHRYSGIENKTIVFNIENKDSSSISGAIVVGINHEIKSIYWAEHLKDVGDNTNKIYLDMRSVVWDKGDFKIRYANMLSALNSTRGVSDDAFYWIAGLILNADTLGNSTNWNSLVINSNRTRYVLVRHISKVVISLEYDPKTHQIFRISEKATIPFVGFDENIYFNEK